MSDVGIEVVRYIHERMKVDAEWSVWNERGFVWWGDSLAQRIWAEETFEEGGDTLCRVHVQTDFLDGFTATDEQLIRLVKIAPLVTTSGFVRDPDNPRKLRLAASLYVHEQVRPWMQELLSWIAPIQAGEAEHFQQLLAAQGETEAHLDESVHPTSGPRPDRDDMLNLAHLVVRPRGDEPSRWIGPDLTQLTNLFQRPPCLLANGDESGVTAEFPFPDYSCLLRIWTNQEHPIHGNGCLLTLTLPHGTKSTASMRDALALNDAEIHDALTRAYFLGSWGVTAQGLTFVSFFPNALHAPGSIISLGLNMARRARAISEELHHYDWDEKFEKDFEAKMAAYAEFVRSLGVNMDKGEESE